MNDDLDTYVARPPRHFIAWSEPGGDELGRVEIIPGGNIKQPSWIRGRTAEAASIPAGSVLTFIVEQPDEV